MSTLLEAVLTLSFARSLAVLLCAGWHEGS